MVSFLVPLTLHSGYVKTQIKHSSWFNVVIRRHPLDLNYTGRKWHQNQLKLKTTSWLKGRIGLSLLFLQLSSLKTNKHPKLASNTQKLYSRRPPRVRTGSGSGGLQRARSAWLALRSRLFFRRLFRSWRDEEKRRGLAAGLGAFMVHLRSKQTQPTC